MIIRISAPPVLVPYHRTEGWLTDRAPPIGMRAVWTGRVLVASNFLPPYCHEVPKKGIKVLSLARAVIDGRSNHTAACRCGGGSSSMPIYLVERKKGLMTVASMDVAEIVYEWYRLRWPVGCDFVFHWNEACVLDE